MYEILSHTIGGKLYKIINLISLFDKKFEFFPENFDISTKNITGARNIIYRHLGENVSFKSFTFQEYSCSSPVDHKIVMSNLFKSDPRRKSRQLRSGIFTAHSIC